MSTWTHDEKKILIDSMRNQIGMLYKMSVEYRDGGNTEAQIDCIEEIRKINKLSDKVKAL
jgi:hypothetical protein